MIELASLFQDHAVLQRDTLIPCWGWTQPDTLVVAKLGPHAAQTLSNDRGEFFLKFPEMPAGGPHTLRVEISATGESRTVEDVLIGEVWLGSGQSNMRWKTADCGRYVEQLAGDAEHPAIRLFTVGNRDHLGRQTTCDGEWQLCTRESALEFSAVAFSFARTIHQQLAVPVGIICSAWGGTRIETWISEAGLSQIPGLEPALRDYARLAHSPERWARMDEANADGLISNLPIDAGNCGLENRWAAANFADDDWPTMDLPCRWQNAGHEHSGVFWFRKTVRIPASWVGRALTLDLGCIDKLDVSYVNGREIARTGADHDSSFWSVERSYPVPATLAADNELALAIRVVSFSGDGGLTGPAPAMRLHPADAPDDAISLAGQWRYAVEQNYGVVDAEHLPGHRNPNSFHLLFDNKISPLVPYALRGFLWYQGESNAAQAAQYATLQSALIADWRRAWARPGLPFNLVQLPNFGAPEGYSPHGHWPRLRAAQAEAAEQPNVGLAITLDLGDPLDIHPHDKAPVGERLARIALADTYGMNIRADGPVLESVTRNGGSIRCAFANVGDSLRCRGGGTLENFFIAGSDGDFRPAEAIIEGTTVVVANPSIPEPEQVAYAWSDSPLPGLLVDAEGLPAAPFQRRISDSHAKPRSREGI